MKRFLLSIALFTCVATVGMSQPQRDPWMYDNSNRDWRPEWNNRPFPRAGACLFTEPGFRGNRFCVRRGDRLDALPGNFGDNISSIQLFGGARIRVFNDRGFSGGSQVFGDSIGDLRNTRFRGGHTWNNRISSVQVR